MTWGKEIRSATCVPWRPQHWPPPLPCHTPSLATGADRQTSSSRSFELAQCNCRARPPHHSHPGFGRLEQQHYSRLFDYLSGSVQASGSSLLGPPRLQARSAQSWCLLSVCKRASSWGGKAELGERWWIEVFFKVPNPEPERKSGRSLQLHRAPG